jgi:hypothetical protein
MKREYDFSAGKRGKFYRAGAKLNLPVYLDQEVLAYLQKLAAAKGVEIGTLVNDILRRDIEAIEAVK